MSHQPPVDGAPVPQRPKDVFFVEPILAAAKFQFRVWSPAVWGVWTHYHDATSPCYETHKHCALSHDPETLRWKGYVFGWHQGLNKPAFVQLTTAVVWQWWEQLAQGVNMRGQLVSISRGAKRNSRLSIQTCPYQSEAPAKMPKDLHPRASLYNLWKMHDPGWAWAKTPLTVAIPPELAVTG